MIRDYIKDFCVELILYLTLLFFVGGTFDVFIILVSERLALNRTNTDNGVVCGI